MMIYFTGDIHGAVDGITDFVNKIHPTMEDVIVLLGDVGANYYKGRRDNLVKSFLNDAGTVFLCIHGNHEMRPTSIPGYIEIEWHDGKAWMQPEYPNLIFAKDGEIYTLNGLRYLVIGGAYSVDKYYRLSQGWGWWADEQPSDEITAYVEKQIQDKPVDIVLSHTCPFKYEPTEMFLGGIDQSTVDDSTERWLDKIEESIDYKACSASIGIPTSELTRCTSCSIRLSPTSNSTSGRNNRYEKTAFYFRDGTHHIQRVR